MRVRVRVRVSTSEASGTASERILRLKCFEASRKRSRTVVNVGTW